MEFKHEIVVEGVKFVKDFQKMFRDPNHPEKWILDVRYEQTEG